MLRSKLLLLPLMFIFLFSFTLLTAEENDPKSWTIDDVLNQESAGSFDISPCGKWVVWVKSRPDKKENKKVGDIYLTSLLDSTEVQLTRGKFNDRNPKWSPKGKMIAFLSSREKEKGAQIWLMNSRGGESWALTDLKNGVKSIVWCTEKNIIFSARENPTNYELELKKKKDDAIVVGDQEHFWPVRLFQVDVKSKKIKRLSDNSGKISEFVLSRCGTWVVTNESQDVHYQYDHKIPPKQFLYNLKKKSREEIFVEKNMRPSRFVWELDGSGFYCSQPLASNPNDDYVSVRTLCYFNIKTKQYQEVPLRWKWHLGFFGYAMTKEGVLVSLANGTKNKLAFYKKEGDKWAKSFLDDKTSENMFINSVNKKGDLAIFSYSTASIPAQIKIGKINGNKIINQKEIIKLNKYLKKKHISSSEVINWKGAKNDKVDGILYYPHKYEEGKKYPLMCVIHGGPAGADINRFSERWSNYPNLLASKGCFVLKVNYHGSGNYGLKWVESIKKHYYEYEVPDILILLCQIYKFMFLMM